MLFSLRPIEGEPEGNKHGSEDAVPDNMEGNCFSFVFIFPKSGAKFMLFFIHAHEHAENVVSFHCLLLLTILIISYNDNRWLLSEMMQLKKSDKVHGIAGKSIIDLIKVSVEVETILVLDD